MSKRLLDQSSRFFTGCRGLMAVKVSHLFCDPPDSCQMPVHRMNHNLYIIIGLWNCQGRGVRGRTDGRAGKGKERKRIQRLLYTMYISKRSGMDHKVLHANTPCLPFLRMRSPDGATCNWGKRHLIAAYYSSIDPEKMKGWVGLVGWPIADGLPT